MTRALIVQSAGPMMSLQDGGRPGLLAQGLSRGGAADRVALAEGAALLGQRGDVAALEMAGMGGVFEATCDTRIALTGAPMRATLAGAPLVWGASHWLRAGQTLEIGPVLAGGYGYLHVGGGFATDRVLGARGAHLAAGIGRVLASGDRLALGPDPGGDAGLALPAYDRSGGGVLRAVAGPQTAMFDPDEIARFEATRFTRDARGNRMGVRLIPEGAGFHTQAGLSVLSEIVVPGDIQITGDGTPMVLLSECQTTGGYPRIGTVLPCDLPRVAQAPPGAVLTVRFVERAEALEAERAAAEAVRALPGRLTRLVRDPRDIRDLLAYQLISGVTAGETEEA
ncbi:biotin-dependent carboxyltransferase family protein [Roseibacterium sp. SDUM158017]|uniref:5-oxoprolinase subunit C family protein n=1 Tax=Roseicyclus salinarum TaxID=3036773 RepID=UPI002414DD20|nr:biotin-dependent carboxyltransferase family protein [Roseibacterium sp. SDUM158017]MDG4650596.1 biotin-dependent carboxyltransferase family protein [Roseibacterium sp. SDUM158017]